LEYKIHVGKLVEVRNFYRISAKCHYENLVRWVMPGDHPLTHSYKVPENPVEVGSSFAPRVVYTRFRKIRWRWGVVLLPELFIQGSGKSGGGGE